MGFLKMLANMISFGEDGWHHATATFTGECMDMGHGDPVPGEKSETVRESLRYG